MQHHRHSQIHQHIYTRIHTELLSRQVLFQGKDCVDMLKKIIHACGSPNLLRMNASCYGSRALKFLGSLPTSKGTLVGDMAEKCSMQSSVWDEDACELLTELLAFDDHKRIRADECFVLKFFKDLHDPLDEPSSAPCGAHMMDFDTKRVTAKQLQELIFSEARLYSARGVQPAGPI